jgi:NCS1 family nucleobase:cation symporter-1
MLKAIWPSVARIPNKLDGNITSTGMMCYFLFWLLQLPFLLISPQGLRWLFMAKALIVPPTFLAMMIWAFATTGGGEILHQRGALSGSALAWAWLGALNSTLGNFSTLAVNIPDFTRYARSERE